MKGRIRGSLSYVLASPAPYSLRSEHTEGRTGWLRYAVLSLGAFFLSLFHGKNEKRNNSQKNRQRDWDSLPFFSLGSCTDGSRRMPFCPSDESPCLTTCFPLSLSLRLPPLRIDTPSLLYSYRYEYTSLQLLSFYLPRFINLCVCACMPVYLYIRADDGV